MLARTLLRGSLAALSLVLAACQMNGRTNEGPASGPSETPREQHLLLVVQHDATGFHVRDSKRVDGPVPTSRVADDQPWRVDVEGGGATRLFTVGMPQKGELRGEFAAADGGIEAVHLSPEQFAFVVRVPLLKDAQRIRFWNERASTTAPGGVELGSVAYPAVER